MTKRSLDRFRKWHDMLGEWTPIKEAECLAKETVCPKTAGAKEIWKILWDKPLFTNVSAEVGEHWRDQIACRMSGAWREWGADIDEFRIRRKSPGMNNECFEVLGDKALEFVEPLGDFPRVRLYAIQGAAAVMRSCRRPFAHLPNFPLVSEITVRELEADLGWRWGHTTVMHVLTDVGLSVKPDRQLARTVKALDLVPGVPKDDAPTRAEAVEINRGVFGLLDAIRSARRTDIPDSPRYLDKVLMEISRKELL